MVEHYKSLNTCWVDIVYYCDLINLSVEERKNELAHEHVINVEWNFYTKSGNKQLNKSYGLLFVTLLERVLSRFYILLLDHSFQTQSIVISTENFDLL